MSSGKPCTCGSGRARRELVDAMGIFCCFVCDRCERTKRKEFDPAIFDGRTYPSDEPIFDDDRDVGPFGREDDR